MSDESFNSTKIMGLDKKDIEMMCVSIPVVDYWSIREDLDRLEDTVERLENVVECLVELYRSERIKNWELILGEMLKKNEQKKGNADERRFR